MRKILFTMVLFFIASELLIPQNNALSFDGSNDYVTVPNSSQLDFSASTGFTLEAWVKLNGSQSNYTGITTEAGDMTGFGFQLVIVNNCIAAELHDIHDNFAGVDAGLKGTTNLNDNNWHHLAMVVTQSSTNVKLYVDGIMEANVDNAAVVYSELNYTSNLLLGTERTYNNHFNGSIEEVRIWNTARSQAEIQNNKSVEIDPSSAGLVAYYRLNQGTAGGANSEITYATDATSYANNGTLCNFSLVGETSNWVLANNSALPVELVSFAASLNNGFIELIWQTATEVNNYGFSVERRTKNEEWKEIGFVEGSGNSNSQKEYSFIDDLTLNRNHNLSYRLKQIDNDGTFKYSDVVDVAINVQPSTFELYQNYPNPFNPVTKIKYSIQTSPYNPSSYQGEGNRERLVSLKVYDILGNEVATLVDEEKPEGNYEVEFNGSKLSSGIYCYRLKAGNFIETRTMVLMK